MATYETVPVAPLPTPLRIAAGLTLALGALEVVASLFLMFLGTAISGFFDFPFPFSPFGFASAVLSFLGAVGLAIGGVTAFTGASLVTKRPWAWSVAVAVNVIALALSIGPHFFLVVILAGGSLWGLFHRDTRAAFGR